MINQKIIKYYQVEVTINLNSYDNNPALTHKWLSLKRDKKTFKFNTRKQAEKFISTISENLIKIRKLTN